MEGHSLLAVLVVDRLAEGKLLVRPLLGHPICLPLHRLLNHLEAVLHRLHLLDS